MPEMPAFLANVLEPKFARPAQITAVNDLAPRLRRVTFEGPALRRASFWPGREVEFRVSERAFRHYTPSRFDTARGAFDVLFFLHGGGPGSSWAEHLREGQQVNVLGPGGDLALREGSTTHVLLGDETALGLFACLATAAPCRGAIEVGHGDQGWPALAGTELDAVERGAERGDALLAWLERSGLLEPTPGTTFYLAGHAGSIVRLRAALLAHRWPRGQVKTKAYWADGKRGL